jgi:hypothetical protein
MPLGSVSRTFRLIVCSFCPQMLHRNSWPLRLAMSPRLPLSYPSFAGEQRQCITSEAVVGSLPSSQPHHSTNAFKTPRRREAFACPCLPGRHAILPSPYPACRMNAPLARALALTVRLLSIATPPLSCVACRWAIHRAPPTLHAQLQLLYSLQRPVFEFCPFIHASNEISKTKRHCARDLRARQPIR